MPDLLATELWIRVFEHAHGNEEFFRLATICKAWNQCVMPLVYEHIELRTAASLQTLTSLLMDSHTTDYGCHTRSLTLRIRSPSHDHLSNVLTLLIHMPNLRSYNTVLQITPNELAVLAKRCGSTLERCQIPVVDEGRRTTSMMKRLSTFQSLRTLEIHVIWPTYADDVDYSTSTFTLPSLTLLCLRTNGPSSCVNFLLCAQMPKLLSLELNFYNLEDVFFRLLSVFLQRHAHLITHLTISALDEWLERILSLHMSPSSVMFAGGIPSVRALEHLPASVRTVALREREWTGRLWDFLHVLLALPRTALREVGVYLPNGFEWHQFAASASVPPSDEHALFFGKMLWFAQRLRVRGLELLDEKGRNMDAAFPKA